MEVRQAGERDTEKLSELVARFRVELGRLKGAEGEPDIAAAAEELAEYGRKAYPVFVAEGDAGGIAGHLVCRVDGKTVWAESLYVEPEYRRRGVASGLYAEAERLAAKIGGETVYNWVHPNNEAVIAFLAKRGYDVLNLVELRKARAGEKPAGKVRVGEHEFEY